MSTGNTGKKVSRRQALLGAGAVAGATAAFGLPGEASAGTTGPTHWDREADVICVGLGAAGGTAAVTASALGAEVLVLEKMPLPGGTTAKSGGIAWIPNHKFIRAAGLQDDRDDCLRYMARYSFPVAYDASSPTLGLPADIYQRLTAFYDNGAKMVDWMERVGALKFKPFKMWQVNVDAPDYCSQLPEDKLTHARALEVAAGGMSGALTFSGGGAMVQQLETWLADQKVPVLLEHRVVGVVKDGERVVGVQVQNGDKLLHIQARKGVIFTSGGYAHNLELIRLHQPGLFGSCAPTSSMGDFIPIAGVAGAKMGNLGTAWRTPVVLEHALANRALASGAYGIPGDSMIHVNKHGMRVVNERRNYNDRTRAHFSFDPVNAEYPNIFMLMVFDERTLNLYGGTYPLPANRREASWMISGATTQELAQNVAARLTKLGGKVGSYRLADDFAANLDATIERFNKFAQTGVDEDFERGRYEYDRAWLPLFSPPAKDSAYPVNDKPNPTMYPIDRTGKLYAILLAPGALDTSGGPAVNADGQVLSAKGAPIPGLYGAGNCVASATGHAYMGAGSTIGPAMTFAYIAAHHVLGRPT